MKSFRDLLSSQGRTYKIAPNVYHQTELKLSGLEDESSASRSIDDLYSVKLNKVDGVTTKRNFADTLCGGFVRFVGSYNSSFCLTVLTPVACR